MVDARFRNFSMGAARQYCYCMQGCIAKPSVLANAMPIGKRPMAHYKVIIVVEINARVVEACVF